MIWLGDILNALVCVIILIVSYVFYARQLSPACARRQEKEPEFDICIRRAFLFWMCSWFLWAVLYGARIWGRRYATTSEDTEEFLVQLISDINSIYLFLVAYVITRGKDVSAAHVRYLCFGLVGGIILYDLGILVLGYVVSSEDGNMFLVPWSAALSMTAPLCVGVAFGLRYRITIVAIAAIVYAAVQPFAYGVAFSLEEDRSIPISVSEAIDLTTGFEDHVYEMGRRDGMVEYEVHLRGKRFLSDVDERTLIQRVEDPKSGTTKLEQWLFFIRLRAEAITFSALAVLKFLWGAAVLYGIRLKPTSLDSALSPSGRPDKDLVASWKPYVFTQCVLAGGAILAIPYLFGADVAILVVGFMLGAGIIAGFLTNIKKIWHAVSKLFRP